jgi:hypothetical protein
VTNDELKCLLDAIEQRWHDRLNAEIRRIDDLRGADLLAREVAFSAVQAVMTGFPQEYARRGDLEGIRDKAITLDKETVKSEVYDQAHSNLETRVDQKLDRQVFDTALTEWSTWRTGVNDALRLKQGMEQGVASTFRWGIAALGAVISVTTFLILYLN